MPQQINLYNPAFEEQRALLSWNSAVAGWLIMAVLVAASAAYQSVSLHSAGQRDRELAAQVASAQAETRRLASAASSRKQDPRITAEISRLEADLKGRQEVMSVLQAGGLGNTRGFSDHLKAFARQSFEGVWLTGLSIATAGRDVSVEGRALQAAYVPGYLKRLNGESAMQGHPFSELLIQMPTPEPGTKGNVRPNYVEFRLTTKSGPASAPKAGAQ